MLDDFNFQPWQVYTLSVNALSVAPLSNWYAYRQFHLPRIGIILGSLLSQDRYARSLFPPKTGTPSCQPSQAIYSPGTYPPRARTLPGHLYTHGTDSPRHSYHDTLPLLVPDISHPIVPSPHWSNHQSLVITITLPGPHPPFNPHPQHPATIASQTPAQDCLAGTLTLPRWDISEWICPWLRDA